MKARSFILGLAGCFAIAFISCDRDGNTGNGANDPTSQFESDKTKKAGDFNTTDTSQTTVPTTNDTTAKEKQH